MPVNLSKQCSSYRNLNTSVTIEHHTAFMIDSRRLNIKYMHAKALHEYADFSVEDNCTQSGVIDSNLIGCHTGTGGITKAGRHA